MKWRERNQQPGADIRRCDVLGCGAPAVATLHHYAWASSAFCALHRRAWHAGQLEPVPEETGA